MTNTGDRGTILGMKDIKSIVKNQKGCIAECYVMRQLSLLGYDPIRIAGSSPVDIMTTEGIRFEIKSSSGVRAGTGLSHYTFGFLEKYLGLLKKKKEIKTYTDVFVCIGWGDNFIDPLFVVSLSVEEILDYIGDSGTLVVHYHPGKGVFKIGHAEGEVIKKNIGSFGVVPRIKAEDLTCKRIGTATKKKYLN